MARRRNTGLYEDVSPSLIVPDHFSTNVSTPVQVDLHQSEHASYFCFTACSKVPQLSSSMMNKWEWRRTIWLSFFPEKWVEGPSKKLSPGKLTAEHSSWRLQVSAWLHVVASIVWRCSDSLLAALDLLHHSHERMMQYIRCYEWTPPDYKAFAMGVALRDFAHT